jgi:hypothetical protein
VGKILILKFFAAKVEEEVRNNWELLAKGKLELEPGLEEYVKKCPRKHLGLRWENKGIVYGFGSDPHVFGPPGSGSTSQRYGSGSGSFYQQAKIVRKTLIPTVL